MQAVWERFWVEIRTTSQEREFSCACLLPESRVHSHDRSVSTRKYIIDEYLSPGVRFTSSIQHRPYRSNIRRSLCIICSNQYHHVSSRCIWGHFIKSSSKTFDGVTCNAAACINPLPFFFHVRAHSLDDFYTMCNRVSVH
ncbi:hypothetical protein MT325_m824L [Paramecium bursaria chlorella virus MT325]|uniref:Uncharacterized protein m824L n=1 Tax=Paramecium bursaria Chlorella virus MT325 TaxID=346932 RepID=A7IVK4_PBCVM|nr:hypothetical protein MT325_m824L [Paramecium bursaria chlorella virus MT325]